MEELKISYEIKSIRFVNVKKKPLMNINPHGRVAAIEDPNTNLTPWESGTIVTYLI